MSLDRPISRLPLPGAARPPPAFQALVGGLQTGPTLLRHDGNEAGIAVELAPAGARVLFGLPAVELTSTAVDLADLLGPPGRVLPERLAGAPDWSRRFRLLDEVLVAAARWRPGPPPQVAHAWRRLLAAGGQLPVKDLAVEVGWSRRHFTETFHREVGLPPRQFVRVLRFERSAIALARRADAPLAELAQRCGFYDQAHLYREWRDLAGCPPAVWARQEELPSVHDGVQGAVAG